MSRLEGGAEVVQVVDQYGNFNEELNSFVQRSNVGKSGTNYQIISITGPQSSGKSTLMNVLVSRGFVLQHKKAIQTQDEAHLTYRNYKNSNFPLLQFGTTFEEMDAVSGRSQTTKGIWLANSEKIPEPSSLIVDLEGSDGRERGEDDNSFERQSSLFALAISDILVVNMWAKDVGREAGAGKPLLKTIFQVNLNAFAFILLGQATGTPIWEAKLTVVDMEARTAYDYGAAAKTSIIL